MKKIFIIVILLFIAQSLSAQNYKKVKIYFENKEDLKEIYELGLDIDHGFIGKDNSLSAFIDNEKFRLLAESGFSFEILIDDWFGYYNSLPRLLEGEKQRFINRSSEKFGVTGFDYGSMGGYYTMQEIYNELDNMRTQFPNLITAKFSIGKTFENRDIYVAKISDNPDIDENEPKVFFNSLIHCREPQGMMALMYYMFYLLENYGTDPEVTYLVDNREIYFLPIINVDGYEYNRSTNPNGGGMWRKNRRGNGTSVWGIDLNRNFGYQWGYDNNGSSPNQGSDTYRGTAPFSEPETQVVRDFCIQKNFKTVLNYHTYSNYLLSPWGYVTQQSPDSDIFREYQSDMTKYNGYEWGLPGEILYEVNGGADDWMYGEQSLKQKAISMTPEVGGDSDGFWPPQSRIFPLAEENLFPNLYITWAAGGFVKFYSANFDHQYFNPGQSSNMTVLVKNKGLSDASNISIELISPGNKITVNSGVEILGGIPSRQIDSNSTPFNFTVSASAVAGEKLPLIVTVKTGSVQMSSDTLFITVGMPTALFEDNTDNPAENWTITTTNQTYKWEATTTSYYSAPTSFTESKAGNYPDNVTITMTLTNQVDLSGISHPFLSYWTKWNMEENWDYGQVSLSTNNGSTWIPLTGNYTNPGTGSFQPSGQPLYDGVQSTWVKEEIDLSTYASSQIKLRFQLKSDGSQTRDGWYVDDIKIFYYSTGILTKNISVKNGWNMISIPLDADDMSVETLFPDAVSDAFGYDGIYNVVTEFENGNGYWLKFGADDTVPVSGTLYGGEITVNAGWNMIGTTEEEINIENISTTPDGIIASDFFGFDGTYNSVNILSPGCGYWVKVTQAGKLIFNTSQNRSGANTNEMEIFSDPEREINFILKNASGKEIELKTGLLSEATEHIDRELGEFEIPPFPPAGLFYSAFELPSGERSINDFRKGDNEFEGIYEYVICINGTTEEEIKISWILPMWTRATISDTFNGSILNEHFSPGSGEITVPASLKKIKLEINYDLPAADISSFSSALTNDSIELLWSTSKERNNTGFNVERSKDGINFEIIGFVPGKDKYDGSSEYSFIDTRAAGGKFYYRLSMTDTGGNKYYSDIIEAELEIPVEFALQQNYPNPFNPSTTIKFDLPVQSNITLELFDVLGRKAALIAEGQFEAGHHRAVLKKGELSTGVYVYSLTASGVNGRVFKESKKLVIVK